VLFCSNGEQVVVSPPREGFAWLTYTFEGLSFDGIYEFEVDGGDGQIYKVVYRGGRCEMP
jgi:hypothetical protein